ncbi:gamma-glutamyl-gamma-aminobutyrate hydrolase family protein [Bowmanella dokdonensis]
MQILDGLVISGGSDLAPSLYGQMPQADDKYDLPRDKLEYRTLAFARQASLPVLGICRGCQLMNITLGGDLYQDIASRRQLTPNGVMLLPRKAVQLDSGSLTARLLNAEQIKINSIHHQAIDRIGDGFDAAGRDADGFIQAIEHRTLPWLGVQWHPEYLFYLSAQINLFRWLIGQTQKSNRIVPE